MKSKTENFYDFIKERESIRLKKLQGLPFPWSDNSILSAYKFTNVRREHDKTTQRLIELFYSRQGKNSPTEIMLFNCALFRYFGTWEFAYALGWQSIFDPKKIITLARSRLENKERVFTGAYIITNQGIKAPKEEVVVNVFLKELWENKERIAATAKSTNSWERTSEVLSQITGFGGSGFMAKETLLDTMHCAFWQGGLPNDYWDWTPIGPGARRGINRLLEHSIDASLSTEKMLSVIMEITHMQEIYWPKEWGRLAPTDVQFQLCEFDKMERVRLGQGRPRSRYRPQ